MLVTAVWRSTMLTVKLPLFFDKLKWKTIATHESLICAYSITTISSSLHVVSCNIRLLRSIRKQSCCSVTKTMNGLVFGVGIFYHLLKYELHACYRWECWCCASQFSSDSYGVEWSIKEKDIHTASHSLSKRDSLISIYLVLFWYSDV